MISLVFIAGYFIFALFKLKWAVLALPLFFPAYLLNFKIFNIPFTLIECLIYVTFLASLLRLILNKFFIQIDRSEAEVNNNVAVRPQQQSVFMSILKDKTWLPVLLLLLASIISVLIVPKEILLIDGKTLFASQQVALGILKGWIMVPIIMFFLFAFFVRDAKNLRYLLNFYTLSSLFLAIWALYQVISNQYITPDMRASGPFVSANYLALYMTPAVFYAFLNCKTFIWKIVLIVLAIALIFTKSYAAMMALMLAVFGYILLLYLNKNSYAKMKKVLWKPVLLFVLFLASVLVIFIILDPAKWQQFFQFSVRGSSAVRLEIYQIAIRLIAERPFLGIGLGQFPAVYQLEAPGILGRAPYEWNMLHPHNLFLAFWLNLGLIGITALVWIIVLCGRKSLFLLKTFSKKTPNYPDYFVKVKIAGLFMFFIVIFQGLFDTPFFKNDLALLFWLIVSVILFPLDRSEAEVNNNVAVRPQLLDRSEAEVNNNVAVRP